MKTFALIVLATLGVCVEAGLTVLTPSCNLKDKDGQPFPPETCASQTSTFTMDYRGGQQLVKGKILNLPACDADGEPKGKCYMVTEALFGAIPYGEQISGAVFYNFLGDAKTGCSPITSDFGINEDDENPSTKILLVDRGVCSFVRKVRMAQVHISALTSNSGFTDCFRFVRIVECWSCCRNCHEQRLSIQEDSLYG